MLRNACGNWNVKATATERDEAAAYEILVHKLQEVNPGVNRDSVGKNNNMRSFKRKKYKKRTSYLQEIGR
jgi:hypothetical protein